MMLWLWLCCEVQHRHVQEISLKCSCVIGTWTTRHADDGTVLRDTLLCLATGPYALGEEPQLVRGSWGSDTAAWNENNILKAAWGKVVQPGKHGHPRRLGPTSRRGKDTQHGWAVIPAASAIVSPAQGHQTIGESPLPTRRQLVLLEMSQGIQDFVAWIVETRQRACGTLMSSWRKSWVPGRDPSRPLFWQLNCALCIRI